MSGVFRRSWHPRPRRRVLPSTTAGGPVTGSGSGSIGALTGSVSASLRTVQGSGSGAAGALTGSVSASLRTVLASSATGTVTLAVPDVTGERIALATSATGTVTLAGGSASGVPVAVATGTGTVTLAAGAVSASLRTVLATSATGTVALTGTVSASLRTVAASAATGSIGTLTGSGTGIIPGANPGTTTLVEYGTASGATQSGTITSPTSGDLYIVCLAVLWSAAESGDVVTISGLGATWNAFPTEAGGPPWQTNTDRQQYLFWATDADTTGTVSWSETSSGSITDINWIVAHIPGTWGATPITEIDSVESRNNSSTTVGTDGTGTLADTGDRVFAVSHISNSKTITNDAQFTLPTNGNQGGNSVYHLYFAEDADGSESDYTISWSGFSNHSIVLFSITTGANTVTGSASGSIGTLTGTVTADRVALATSATGTVTLAAGTATAVPVVTATGSGSLGTLTGTVSAERIVEASASGSVGALTGSAIGITPGQIIGTATGTVTLSGGSASGERTSLATSATGTVAFTGTVSASLRTVTATAAAGSIGALTGAGTGVSPVTRGTGVGTLDLLQPQVANTLRIVLGNNVPQQDVVIRGHAEGLRIFTVTENTGRKVIGPLPLINQWRP